MCKRKAAEHCQKYTVYVTGRNNSKRMPLSKHKKYNAEELATLKET